jgi:phosphoserine phosphatase
VNFDSGSQFMRFTMKRHPKLLRYLPRIGFHFARFVRHYRIQFKPYRGEYYEFILALPDFREEVRLFWEAKAEQALQPWYLAQLRPDDIIISCSPDFLLRPLCEQLGVRLVSTRVNYGTGRLESYSCYGAEKVRRLREEFGDIEIGEFYSDSLTDAPLAQLAQKAFYVKGEKRTPWPK